MPVSDQIETAFVELYIPSTDHSLKLVRLHLYVPRCELYALALGVFLRPNPSLTKDFIVLLNI
jgi:hypothetical protein